MKRRTEYLISGILLGTLSKNRIWWSKDRKRLRLYNKNSFKWQSFFNVRQEINRDCYCGEIMRLDPYWKNVILKNK